jgi:XTP/dITP diphosphohydrolase
MSGHRRVVLASSNPGKIRELNGLLAGADIEVIPQSHFRVPEAEEAGLSFVENAIIKARNASEHAGMPAIADDSGICVDELGGAPGVRSARYAGVGASDADNLNKLLTDMAGVPAARRQARFYCVIAYLRHADDPAPLLCQGVWEGHLLFEPHGENGFGYDPIFGVPEYDCSSAQLEPAVKNALSHRGKALRQLVRLLESL